KTIATRAGKQGEEVFEGEKERGGDRARPLSDHSGYILLSAEKDGLYGAPSDDVLLEILDGFALRRNDPLDQIADRDDTNDFLTLDDGKMTNPSGCDESHAIVYGLVRAYGHDG